MEENYSRDLIGEVPSISLLKPSKTGELGPEGKLTLAAKIYRLIILVTMVHKFKNIKGKLGHLWSPQLQQHC